MSKGIITFTIPVRTPSVSSVPVITCNVGLLGL